MVPRFFFFWWKCVDTAFADLDDEDDDLHEHYHAVIKCLILLIGKKLARALILITGAPFAFLYVLISTVLRIFFVVVRVKPGDDEGNYEINFYLEADDEDEDDAGRNNKKGASILSKLGKGYSSSSIAYSGSEKGHGPDGAYTFADAKPDAFAPVPDENPDEVEDDKPKVESKGAKRMKKKLEAKQSFVIDPEIYNDPSALAPPAKRTINKSPSTKLTAKLSFNNNDGRSAIAAQATPPTGSAVPRSSITDIGSGSSGGLGPRSDSGRVISPKTSFNLSDGLTSVIKKVSPKTSFNLNDGSSAASPKHQHLGSNASSFNSMDGDTNKLSPKMSFSSMDAFLGLVPLKRLTPRLSVDSDVDIAASVPSQDPPLGVHQGGVGGESPPDGQHRDKAHQLINQTSTHVVKYASKVFHKVGKLHSTAGGEGADEQCSSDLDIDEGGLGVQGKQLQPAGPFRSGTAGSSPITADGNVPEMGANTSPSLSRDASTVLRSSNAVKFASKMLREVSLKPKTSTAIEELNFSDDDDAGVQYDENGVPIRKKNKERNPLAMFGLKKGKSRSSGGAEKINFHPDDVYEDNYQTASGGRGGMLRERSSSATAAQLTAADRSSAMGSSRANSLGTAMPPQKKKNSRRMSKQDSSSSKRAYRSRESRDSVPDSSQTADTPRDGDEGKYRLFIYCCIFTEGRF